MVSEPILVATPGSAVLEDGSGVEIEGVGTFALGDTVQSPRLGESGRGGSPLEQLRGYDLCGDYGLAVFLDPR